MRKCMLCQKNYPCPYNFSFHQPTHTETRQTNTTEWTQVMSKCTTHCYYLHRSDSSHEWPDQHCCTCEWPLNSHSQIVCLCENKQVEIWSSGYGGTEQNVRLTCVWGVSVSQHMLQHFCFQHVCLGNKQQQTPETQKKKKDTSFKITFKVYSKKKKTFRKIHDFLSYTERT